jgi:hypothetical protein
MRWFVAALVIGLGGALVAAPTAREPRSTPAARVAVRHGRRIPAPPAPGELSAQATTGWTARNWSGYALTGTGYRSVTGSWRVPSVTPTKKAAYSATWVGIDGFDNASLIQAGTGQDWSGGTAQYYAWWEILPAPETPIPASIVTVRPGDLMRVTITKGTPTWTIVVTNVTRGQSFTTHQVFNGPGTSAEWIEEAPSIGRRLTRLAVYSLTTFDNGTVNGANPGLTAASRGVMIRGKRVLSTPSFPSVDRDGFATQYGKVVPAAPPA